MNLYDYGDELAAKIAAVQQMIEDGEDVSRLTGYPGEDFFWSLLDRDLKKLRHPCPG